MEAKRQLAHAIAARYHGDADAEAAAERFRAVFSRREAPADAPEHVLPPDETIHLPALLVDAFGLPSRSEARRRLAEGAVRVDGEQLHDLDVPRAALVGRTLQVGRRFVRLVERLSPLREPIRRDPADARGGARRFPLDAEARVPHTPSVAAVGGAQLACPGRRPMVESFFAPERRRTVFEN